MNQSQLQPILFGGLFIGVLSGLPVVNFANCCCLWLIGGGVLTAWLLQRDRAEPPSLGEGAYCGFLAGIAGAVVYLVVSVPIAIATAPFQERMLEFMLNSQSDMPPEVREMIEGFGSEGMIAGLAINFVLHLIGGMIFSTLGGLLGALLFRPSPPGPSSPPGPPYSPGPPPSMPPPPSAAPPPPPPAVPGA